MDAAGVYAGNSVGPPLLIRTPARGHYDDCAYYVTLSLGGASISWSEQHVVPLLPRRLRYVGRADAVKVCRRLTSNIASPIMSSFRRDAWLSTTTAGRPTRGGRGGDALDAEVAAADAEAARIAALRARKEARVERFHDARSRMFGVDMASLEAQMNAKAAATAAEREASRAEAAALAVRLQVAEEEARAGAALKRATLGGTMVAQLEQAEAAARRAKEVEAAEDGACERVEAGQVLLRNV